jgi:hypothetical protein
VVEQKKKESLIELGMKKEDKLTALFAQRKVENKNRA